MDGRMDVDLKEHPVSPCRVAAMVIALGCHVGLLMVLLKPPSALTDSAQLLDDQRAVLELRFVSARPTTSMPSASASGSQGSGALSRHRAPRIERPPSRAPSIGSAMSPLPSHPLGVPAPVAVRETPSAAATPPRASVSDLSTAGANVSGDGGFRSRLLDAQHSQDVRGVPGSDSRLAPGLQLTDPMNQGVGALMRSTQRLFGITDRHCIDVEVWQSLSPEELSARHLSPSDLRDQAAKFNCNRPLGLSF